MVKTTSFKSGKYYIPIIYTLIGIAWILTSDAMLIYLQKQGYLPVSEWVGSAKGVGYVLITGILLYILIAKSDRDLLKSERQYKDIYVSNPYPICFFDPDNYKFLSVNNATLVSYGYSLKEFLSMTIFDIHRTEDVESLKLHFSKVKQEEYEFGKWRQVKKNGDTIYIHSSSLISSFDNKPAIMVVIMDITERIAYEKNLEKSNFHLESTLKSISDSFFTLNRNWVIT